MRLLKVFETRVKEIFGSSAAAAAPFSFKRLAKEALKEFNKETYTISGRLTAPALISILISPSSEGTIIPVYKSLTNEISMLLQAEAERKGAELPGKPLVRFMPDNTIKNRKFMVFAENIDQETLKRLTDEEQRFLVAHRIPGVELPRKRKADQADSSQADSIAARLPKDPFEFDESQYEASAQSENLQSQRIARPAASESTPLVQANRVARRNATKDNHGPVAHQNEAPMSSGPSSEPHTSRRMSAAAGQEDRTPERTRNALLIDRESGATYPVTAPATILGRERASGVISINDPNISRKHAEIALRGNGWIITDLHSTNGTLVNNTEIIEQPLRDGDLITLGLTNLEFRETT